MTRKKYIFPAAISLLFAVIIFAILFTGYTALNRADSEFAAQNYAGAVESYKQAVRFLPWRADLWEKAGIAAAKNKNASEAIGFFEKSPSLSAEGLMWLGYAHYLNGDFSSSITALQKSIQLQRSPSAYQLLELIYRQQKNWDAERDALENQLQMEDGRDAYTYYRLGLLLSVLDPEKALTDLMLASSLDSEFDPAVQTLRAALNLSATQPDASQQMVSIGRALGLVREWDLSATAFEKAIKLNEKNAEAWAWLGEAKQQTGLGLNDSKGQDGLAELDKALSLDSASVVVRALRGLYWNRQEKYHQMLDEYLMAAKYEPDNPAWQAELGNAYVKLGDLVEALASYQRATELEPNESTYWRLLAVFCAENGTCVEDVGLPAAKKAVELAPDDPSTLDALGWSYLSSGRYANAEQILLDVTRRFSDHLPAHIHLAMVYLAQGNRAAAFDTLNHVRSVDPDGESGKLADTLLKQYFQ